MKYSFKNNLHNSTRIDVLEENVSRLALKRLQKS